MVEADAICERLLRESKGKTGPIRLHSIFDRAANFSSEYGMITLLAPDRGLLPYAVRLREKFRFAGLKPGTYRLGPDGIFASARQIVGFGEARCVDLGVDAAILSGSFSGERARSLLRTFLAQHSDRGLVELAFDRREGLYARYLCFRLQRLRHASQTGSDGDFAAAAYGIAGCGEGLTPSSDDLLCGYLLCALSVRGKEAVRKAANLAARRTNEISAALLKRAGEGLFSEDVLALLDCLAANRPAKDVFSALDRVAAFGGSSGCDFLTGLYLGMVDFGVGKEAAAH